VFYGRTVKVGNLPGDNRYQDDEINILGLYHGDGSEAKHPEHENNADEYTKFELFEHG
jgi:hypothetical protein